MKFVWDSSAESRVFIESIVEIICFCPPPCMRENLNAKKAIDSAVSYFFFAKNCHLLLLFYCESYKSQDFKSAIIARNLQILWNIK